MKQILPGILVLLICSCAPAEKKTAVPASNTPETTPAAATAEVRKEPELTFPKGVFDILEVVTPADTSDPYDLILQAKLNVTPGRMLIFSRCTDRFPEDWFLIKDFEIFGYITSGRFETAGEGKTAAVFEFVSFTDSKPESAGKFRTGRIPGPQDFNTKKWMLKEEGDTFLLCSGTASEKTGGFCLRVKKSDIPLTDPELKNKIFLTAFLLPQYQGERLIKLLKKSVTPRVWKPKGKAEMKFSGARLEVKAPERTLKELERLLGMLENDFGLFEEIEKDETGTAWKEEFMKRMTR